MSVSASARLRTIVVSPRFTRAASRYAERAVTNFPTASSASPNPMYAAASFGDRLVSARYASAAWLGDPTRRYRGATRASNAVLSAESPCNDRSSANNSARARRDQLVDECEPGRHALRGAVGAPSSVDGTVIIGDGVARTMHRGEEAGHREIHRAVVLCPIEQRAEHLLGVRSPTLGRHRLREAQCVREVGTVEGNRSRQPVCRLGSLAGIEMRAPLLVEVGGMPARLIALHASEREIKHEEHENQPEHHGERHDELAGARGRHGRHRRVARANHLSPAQGQFDRRAPHRTPARHRRA